MFQIKHIKYNMYGITKILMIENLQRMVVNPGLNLWGNDIPVTIVKPDIVHISSKVKYDLDISYDLVSSLSKKWNFVVII